MILRELIFPQKPSAKITTRIIEDVPLGILVNWLKQTTTVCFFFGSYISKGDDSLNLKTLLARVSAEATLGVALAGVPITAILTGEARLKADDILIELEGKREEDGVMEPMTTQEKLGATWKCYILPTVAGGITIGMMIWSHRIQGRKLIALASAYSITNTAFREYKDKAKELLSKKKLEEIEHAIDQDKVANCTVLDGDILATNSGNILCIDAWGGQKFFSNAEEIREAVARCNSMMVGHVYLALNTLYDELGLPPTKGGEELGWNALFDDAIRVRFSSCLDKEKVPALVMHLEPDPRPMYTDC